MTNHLSETVKRINLKMEDEIEVKVLGINYIIYTSSRIYDEYVEWYTNALKRNKKSAHQPAIGEAFSLELTPTSLGMVYVVIDNNTKEKFNLTCYRNW